jgi:hypothetical protein
MKRGLLTLLALMLCLVAVSPTLAQEEMGCTHEDTTIASLRECVVHAVEMGYITNDNVAQNLLKKLDLAQAKLDSGKVEAAIGLLYGFIEAVEEQAGETIDAMHAEHLIQHAHMVIAALSQ